MRMRGIRPERLGSIAAAMQVAAAGPTVGTQDPTGAPGVWVLALPLGVCSRLALPFAGQACSGGYARIAARFDVPQLLARACCRVPIRPAAENFRRACRATVSRLRTLVTRSSGGDVPGASPRKAACASSEERYRLAVRGADDAIWEWDLKTDRAYFSDALEEHARLRRSRAVRSHRRMVSAHPSRRLGACAAGAQSASRGPHRAPRTRASPAASRRELALGVRARQAVRDAAGEPLALVGLVSDISARKQVERALVEIAEGLSAVDAGRSACASWCAASPQCWACARRSCASAATIRLRACACWRAGRPASSPAA